MYKETSSLTVICQVCLMH